ncbi:MAG: glycosyltransferase family 2 protein [Muribaculaceae bacterium]|nr:glycosyltransferase family 2 protein [Muribaculaceae bacterium]
MKLSIITTVYQAEKDLPRLLDSMKAIKSQEVEFFLIDNGCTDNSLKICENYAVRDIRFVIHRLEENIGYIRARNLGLDIVQADYVGFCDSDDFLDPEGYDRAIAELKENQCDFYTACWNTVYPGKTIHNQPFIPKGEYSGEELKCIIPKFFGKYNGPSHHGFMWKQFVKKSLIDRLNLRFSLDIKPLEDRVFNARLIQNVSSLVVSDVCLYNYIVNDKSITEKIKKNYDLNANLNLYNQYFEELLQASPSETCNLVVRKQWFPAYLSLISLTSKAVNFKQADFLLRNNLKIEKVIENISHAPTTNFTDKILKSLLKSESYWILILLSKLKSKVK